MVNNNKGFTLIELLVSIGMAGVLLAAVFTTFMVQNTSYKRQEQIVEMQQDLRAALNFMTREIRMARSDPLSTKLAGVVNADSDTFQFTTDVGGGGDDKADNDDDGLIDCDPDGTCDDPDELNYPDGEIDDPNENITYALYDAYGDGNIGIGRDTGGGNQPLAENIDILDFVYIGDGDGDGNNEELPRPLSANHMLTIQAIELTIIARTAREDPNYTDTNSYSYVNRDGDTVVLLDKSGDPDGFRRRMVRSTIKIRN